MKAGRCLWLQLVFAAPLAAQDTADVQSEERAPAQVEEEVEVEVEQDASLDDTTGSVELVTADRPFTVSVDVRTSYLDRENDNRDGSTTGSDLFRARWRAQGIYNINDRTRFGARIAGVCSTNECDLNWTFESSIPNQNTINDGDVTIDSLFIHRYRNDRFDVAAGRLQTRFVARGGVFAKSLDRNDSNNLRVNWTDGFHGTFRARNGWVMNGILQYNSASGPSNVRRDPLDFTDDRSRVTYFFAAESLEQQPVLLQRAFSLSYLPKSLLKDGSLGGRLEDYWGIVARTAARWPKRGDGTRLRVSSELGYAGNTQTRAAAGLSGDGDVGGTAWNVTLSVMEFVPNHSIGINYGRTEAGWLLSPQYGDNEELYEIRYMWRRNAQFALDIRARRRIDLEQLLGTERKRDRYDLYVRFTWGYSTRDR